MAYGLNNTHFISFYFPRASHSGNKMCVIQPAGHYTTVTSYVIYLSNQMFFRVLNEKSEELFHFAD